MVFTEIIIGVVCSLIAFAFLFVKKRFSVFSEKGIPHIKPNSWILGNMSGVGTTEHFSSLLQKTYEQCKDEDVIAGFYTMMTPSIVLTDLELIKTVLVKEFNSFTDRGVYVNEENEPLTGHLFNMAGDKWKFLRNKLSPVFTAGKMKTMYNIISDKGDALVKKIELCGGTESIDIKDVTNRFTLDVTSSCAFGLESNTLNNENPELFNIFKELFSPPKGLAILTTFLVFTFPIFSKLFNIRQFSHKIENFFNDIVGGAIKQRETSNVVRNDFLNMLIQLKNKGSIDGGISTETRKLTLGQCIAQSFIFLIGGAEPNSSAITYVLLELGNHLDIQERLRKEVLSITQVSRGEITYDNLQEMAYLNQVVNGNPSLCFKYQFISSKIVLFLLRNPSKISTQFTFNSRGSLRFSNPELEACHKERKSNICSCLCHP